MLSDSYKEYKNITLDNIDKAYEKTEEVTVFIDKALKYNVTNNTSIYWASGELITRKNFKKSDFKIMVIINIDTLSFSITPWDYVEKIGLGSLEIGDKIDLNKINYNIEGNKYNAFKYQNSTNENMAQEYFDVYRFNILHNAETAYKILQPDYSKAKFDELEDFRNYIKNNIVKISGASLTGYQVTKTEDYTQYVCIDSSGRYYIFRAKSIVDYDVILDTYWIDVPEFTARYNDATDQEKIVLNINKFNLAINDKDYKYAYSILADSFKTNNFPTLTSFEEYMKSNFFDNNKFEYIEFGNEAGTYYTYKIKVTDADAKSSKVLDKTFIMLLDEGTDFKLSFNLQ